MKTLDSTNGICYHALFAVYARRKITLCKHTNCIMQQIIIVLTELSYDEVPNKKNY